jgi:hypothetical protein
MKVSRAYEGRLSNLWALCVSRPFSLKPVQQAEFAYQYDPRLRRYAAQPSPAAMSENRTGTPHRAVPVQAGLTLRSELAIELVDVPTEVFSVDDASDLHSKAPLASRGLAC